jgi:hypothetical protein
LSAQPTPPPPFPPHRRTELAPLLPIFPSFLLLCLGVKCRHAMSSSDRSPCRMSTPIEPHIGSIMSRRCSPPEPCPRRTDELPTNRHFPVARARCHHHESSSEHHFPTTAPHLCLTSCAPTLPGLQVLVEPPPTTVVSPSPIILPPRREPPPHQHHPSIVSFCSARCA